MRDCRVGVVGDKGVGKNALVHRFVEGDFMEVRTIIWMTRFQTNIFIFRRSVKLMPISARPTQLEANLSTSPYLS